MKKNLESLELVGTGAFSFLTVREQSLVSLNGNAAEVNVDTTHHPFANPPIPPSRSANCSKRSSWTLSGHHSTNINGVTEIDLGKFLRCTPQTLEDVPYQRAYVGSRPHFTATPEVAQPVFLTCSIETEEVQPPDDHVNLPPAVQARVKVYSWDHRGQPAPNIPFNWVAIAQMGWVWVTDDEL